MQMIQISSSQNHHSWQKV